MHTLVIEDDLDLGRAMQKALQLEGIHSTWLRRAGDAPVTFPEPLYDCILLDLGLPDGEGMALLSRWRRSGVAIPVIIVTARLALDERLAGLDGGADDFLVKPFAMSELVSRMRAVTRRYARQAGDLWILGTLEIAPRARTVRIDGIPVELSPREFQLLLELAREPGALVAKSALATRLDPHGEPVNFAAIDVHVYNLRNKIGTARIRTVRGIGYVLEAQ